MKHKLTTTISENIQFFLDAITEVVSSGYAKLIAKTFIICGIFFAMLQWYLGGSFASIIQVFLFTSIGPTVFALAACVVVCFIFTLLMTVGDICRILSGDS